MSETQTTTEAQVEVTDDLDAFTKDFFGQKSGEDKAPETTEAAEQEAEVEVEAQEDDETPEEQEPEAEKPKKKTAQERIDEVVRQREDQRRAFEAQMAEMRRELEELKKGNQPEAKQSVTTEPQPDAMDKDGNPIYPLGEFDPQYIRDLTRHELRVERERADAERAELEQRRTQEQEQQVLQSGWNTKVEAATETYPDFVEKGQALLANFNDLPADYAQYLTTVLQSMDKGPDVLYYLSNHPEEAVAIVNSGAQKATLALGRIEARFSESEQQAPRPKVSQAPPPPPANARARGTNGAFISVAPDTDDQAAFEQVFFQKK